MGWRGLVAMVALVATGIVGGFAAAAYLEPDPITTDAPSPVAAKDPSVPVNPVTLQDDPLQPALRTGLHLHKVSVGTDNYSFVFPAPRDWSREETSSNEVKYKLASNPSNTYLLRVEQVVSQHETIPDILAARIIDLKRDEEDYHEIARTHDSLEFSYVHDGYRRFGFITWLALTPTSQAAEQAEAEIAITGREVDVPGMRELMARVIRGIRTA